MKHVSAQSNEKFTLFWRRQQKQIILRFLKFSILYWIGKVFFWNKLCLYCSGTLVFQFNSKRRQKQECVYMHLHHCIHTLLNAPLCSLCIFQILGNHGPARPFFGLDWFLVFATIGFIPSYLALVPSSGKFRSDSNTRKNMYFIFSSVSEVLMWFCTWLLLVNIRNYQFVKSIRWRRRFCLLKYTFTSQFRLFPGHPV